MKNFIKWFGLTAALTLSFVIAIQLGFWVSDYASNSSSGVIYWITQHPGIALDYFLVIVASGLYAAIIVKEE